MKKIEILDTIEINGEVYPKLKRITYIDEVKPVFSDKKLDIAEKIFSDENLNTLQMDENGK